MRVYGHGEAVAGVEHGVHRLAFRGNPETYGWAFVDAFSAEVDVSVEVGPALECC